MRIVERSFILSSFLSQEGLILRCLRRIRISILWPSAERACKTARKYPDASIGDSPDRSKIFIEKFNGKKYIIWENDKVFKKQ